MLLCQIGLFKALWKAVTWISEPHWCWQYFFLPVTDEELGLSQVGSAGPGSLVRDIQGFARDWMPWSQAGFRSWTFHYEHEADWCPEYTVHQGINGTWKRHVTFPITNVTFLHHQRHCSNQTQYQFPLRYYPKKPELSEGLIISES